AGTTFSTNTTTGNGGAIHVNGATSAAIIALTDCTLDHNEADSGGAISVNSGPITVSDRHGLYSDNVAAVAGGAIASHAKLVLEDGVYRRNDAFRGGAVWSDGGVDGRRNAFRDNTADK